MNNTDTDRASRVPSPDGRLGALGMASGST